jgi:hypothetical protein
MWHLYKWKGNGYFCGAWRMGWNERWGPTLRIHQCCLLLFCIIQYPLALWKRSFKNACPKTSKSQIGLPWPPDHICSSEFLSLFCPRLWIDQYLDFSEKYKGGLVICEWSWLTRVYSRIPLSHLFWSFGANLNSMRNKLLWTAIICL